jgi:signal peptidase I
MFLGFVVLLVLAVAWKLLYTGEVRAVQVISGSMEPTIRTGERLIIGEVAGHVPTRGELVVIEAPDDGGADLVKRVVGIPGDMVELRQGIFLLNGIPSPPPGGAPNWHPGEKDFIRTLGPDEYFVLGDNRMKSHDSTEFGPVNAKSIRAQVLYRYSPWVRRGQVE